MDITVSTTMIFQAQVLSMEMMIDLLNVAMDLKTDPQMKLSMNLQMEVDLDLDLDLETARWTPQVAESTVVYRLFLTCTLLYYVLYYLLYYLLPHSLHLSLYYFLYQ